MFTTMEACTSFIFQLRGGNQDVPLVKMRTILKELGHPEKQVKFLHFAGSNGKGSTLNATREILMAHGQTVGAFISPHLERVNERITINKQEIANDLFLLYMNNIVEIVEHNLDGQYPHFFEIMTLIALQHFAHEKVDIAVLEVGMGGRLDATNVVQPEVSVITTISLEHTNMLGDTHEQIAFEKAGIVKKQVPVVVGVQHPEALRVIVHVAHQQQAPLHQLDQHFWTKKQGNSFDFTSDDFTIEQLTLAMAGEHQIRNAALAIKTCEIYMRQLEPAIVRQALTQAKWRGRFERFGYQIILDGAHNVEGTVALLETLQREEPHRNYVFLYAALADKNHCMSIQFMDEVATALYFTAIDDPRAATAQSLFVQSQHANKHIVPHWQPFMKTKISQLADNEVLVVTGSLYFIGQVRTWLGKEGDI